MWTQGDGKRSQVNANVERGNTDISTPLLLGECGHGLAPYLAHGCFNQIFPFRLLLRDYSLQMLQSSLGLNSTSYVSPNGCLRVGLRRVLLFSSCRCVSKEVTCQTPGWTFQRFPETLLGLSGAVMGEKNSGQSCWPPGWPQELFFS